MVALKGTIVIFTAHTFSLVFTLASVRLQANFIMVEKKIENFFLPQFRVCLITKCFSDFFSEKI